MKNENILYVSKEKIGLATPINPLLKKRWSPRIFSSELLSDEEIAALFEAARWAPSSFNEQPWRFIYAQRSDTEAFEALLGCLSTGNQEWAADVPLLVASIAHTIYTKTGKPNRHAWHDVGQAVAHLSIQATAMNLYVHQMSGFSPDKVRELYGIGPDFEPATMFTIGRLGSLDGVDEERAEREMAPQKRRPVSEWLFDNE